MCVCVPENTYTHPEHIHTFNLHDYKCSIYKFLYQLFDFTKYLLTTNVQGNNTMLKNTSPNASKASHFDPTSCKIDTDYPNYYNINDKKAGTF